MAAHQNWPKVSIRFIVRLVCQVPSRVRLPLHGPILHYGQWGKYRPGAVYLCCVVLAHIIASLQYLPQNTKGKGVL